LKAFDAGRRPETGKIIEENPLNPKNATKN